MPTTRSSTSTTDRSRVDFDGSAAPEADGSAPTASTIKGNADSMLYHVPGSRYYDQTIAEVYFDTVESAEAAGFAAPGRGSNDDAADADEDAADDEES